MIAAMRVAGITKGEGARVFAGPKILPLQDTDGFCVKRSYLAAREEVEKRGMRLAPSVLYYAYSSREGRAKEFAGMNIWGDEFVARPNGSAFRRGEDIIDSYTGWRMLAQYLTNPRYIDGDAFRKGVALVITPEGFEMYKGKPLVSPASISVLNNFRQESGPGLVNNPHGIPVEVVPELMEMHPAIMRDIEVHLYSGMTLRPVVHTFDNSGRQSISVMATPYENHYVLGLPFRALHPNPQPRKADAVARIASQ